MRNVSLTAVVLLRDISTAITTTIGLLGSVLSLDRVLLLCLSFEVMKPEKVFLTAEASLSRMCHSFACEYKCISPHSILPLAERERPSPQQSSNTVQYS
jgi:hypothetical protein